MDKYGTYIISCIRGVRKLPFFAWVYLSVPMSLAKCSMKITDVHAVLQLITYGLRQAA